jgi:hypothetical protein
MHLRFVFAALCLISLAGWSAEPTPAKKQLPELYTLKGEILRGELANIADKGISLKQNGRTILTPLDQVLKIDFPTATAIKLEGKYSDVELTDGSRFHCKAWTIKGESVELKTMADRDVKLPLASIGYILNDAQEEKYRKEWAERMARKHRRDMAVVVAGGTIKAVEGTFGSADAAGENIVFQAAATGRKGNLSLSNLHGLLFHREVDPNAPPMQCKLYDSYGDFFIVSGLKMTPDGLSATTPAGAKLDFAVSALTRLDYTLDKLAFLSRLEPSKVDQRSNFDFVDTYRRDKNLDNGPLRIYSETFTNGLALHAHTELEYDLKGDYREFHALAGIDQSVGGLGGPVVLVIQGVTDGETKELYKKTFTRNVKDKKEGVIDLNIKDVQKLRIVVSTGDLFDNGKHLDLVNAKIQK